MSQKDSLLKQSIEEKIENPLLENNDNPIRDISNPARNKQSVMKVKVPISHDKFKTVVKPIIRKLLTKHLKILNHNIKINHYMSLIVMMMIKIHKNGQKYVII